MEPTEGLGTTGRWVVGILVGVVVGGGFVAAFFICHSNVVVNYNNRNDDKMGTVELVEGVLVGE